MAIWHNFLKREDKIFMQKRERTEEEINVYYDSTKLRIQNNSVRTSCPQNSELTELCLLWEGILKNGYGQIGFNGKTVNVHIVSYMVFNNIIILPRTNDDGELLEIGHKCNVRNCCEPTHLYHITKKQNGEDKAKNGLMRGEKHYNGTVSEKIAQEIKLSRGKGTQRERAEKFGVSLSVVTTIDQGRSWSILPDADGNNSEAKRIKRNETENARRKLLRDTPWTKEMYDEAELKLNDPKYTKIDDSHFFNNSSCIIWIRAHTSGYPRMSIHGQTVSAHAIACIIGNNYIHSQEMEAAHECGQPSCVNPLHLKFKSRIDNAADKIEHGTHATIPWEHILKIREQYAKGEKTQSELAKLYNISSSYVSNIITKKARING